MWTGDTSIEASMARCPTKISQDWLNAKKAAFRGA